MGHPVLFHYWADTIPPGSRAVRSRAQTFRPPIPAPVATEKPVRSEIVDLLRHSNVANPDEAEIETRILKRGY